MMKKVENMREKYGNTFGEEWSVFSLKHCVWVAG